jgi:acetolactate synthase small subunit
LESIDLIDFVAVLELGRDSSVHAEVVIVHNASEGHAFERLKEEVVKGLLFVLTQHFVSEGEMLSHCATFMVATQHYYFFRVVQLIHLSRKVTLSE